MQKRLGMTSILKIKFFKNLFYLCVVALSLGQIAVITEVGDSKVYIYDVLVGIYSTLGLIYLLGAKKSLKIPKFLVGLVIFSLVAFLSLLLRLTTLSSDQIIFAAFYLIRWVIYLISAIVTYNLVLQKRINLNEILNAFIYSALFISIGGFIQLIVLPDFTVLDPLLGWDPHKNRLASTFFDPNFTGGYLALVSSVIIGSYLTKEIRIKTNNLTFKLFVILIGLFLTFSRSSWGMFALIIGIFGVFRARWLIWVGILAIFLAYFAIPRVQTRISGVTDPADSAAFRLVSWGNAWEIAQDNLLFGVGFNAFRYSQEDYAFFSVGTTGGNSGSGSDSSFLLVLATTGVFGFVVFLFSYFYPAYSQFKKGKVVLLAIFVGLFLHSQFVNSLFYPQFMFLWPFLLAVL